MAEKKESAFQADCMKKMRDLGWKAWKQYPYRRDTVDVIVATDTGMTYYLEFKRNDSEKPRPNQVATAQWLATHQHCNAIVRPSNWDTIFADMKKNKHFSDLVEPLKNEQFD